MPVSPAHHGVVGNEGELPLRDCGLRREICFESVKLCKCRVKKRGWENQGSFSEMTFELQKRLAEERGFRLM